MYLLQVFHRHAHTSGFDIRPSDQHRPDPSLQRDRPFLRSDLHQDATNDQVDRRERRSIQELRQDDDHLRRRLHLPMVVVDTGQHMVNGQSSTGRSVHSARGGHQSWRSVQLYRVHGYTLPIQTVGINACNSG